MPVDLERTELRDSASPFIVYVPVGSIKRGATLVTTGGGGKTLRCGTCHADDLRGLGPVPALAGRSLGYVVRQLGPAAWGPPRLWADLMKAAVAKLTVEDMVAIAVYTASRPP
jgi:cytochrome c553